MTQNKDMSDVIYVAGSNVYNANDVFNKNYDGALLAKDAWECKKYIRAEKLEKVREALETSKTHIGSTIVLRGYGDEEYSEVLKALAILDDLGVK